MFRGEGEANIILNEILFQIYNFIFIHIHYKFNNREFFYRFSAAESKMVCAIAEGSVTTKAGVCDVHFERLMTNGTIHLVI